jgi:hypothetical protein
MENALSSLVAGAGGFFGDWKTHRLWAFHKVSLARGELLLYALHAPQTRTQRVQPLQSLRTRSDRSDIGLKRQSQGA